MSRLFPILIILLQVYCIYHAYKNQKAFYWYLIILVFPVIGSLGYLFIHFESRENFESMGEKIKGMVNEEYEVEKLIKESKYSDTITNRIKLADKYASKQRFHEAIALYESCLKGYNADDIQNKEKLMVSKFYIHDYEGVIETGNSLNNEPLFRNSESRIVYAWSLHLLDRNEEAEAVFKDMDVRFSNYVHRSEYAKFLIENSRSLDARDLLSELEDEIAHMDPSEQRQKREIRKEIVSLLKST